MPTLDLTRLERKGRLDIEGEIPVDDPIWEESGLTLAEPLRAKLQAQEAGSGEVVVTGRIEGTLARECRRCLKPLETEFDQEVAIVFGDAENAEEGGEIRPLPTKERNVELAEALREELLLETDPFVECDPKCRGLCPVCGVNRNDETCDCTLDEPDPRWDALRALNSE